MTDSTSFQFQTCGKWILAGEHAVLRGSPALVFPAHHFSMKFTFVYGSEPLHIEMSGEGGRDLELIFWGPLEIALNRVGRARADLTGKLYVDSSIPLGAGLGGSAALCVGVAKLFAHLGWLTNSDIYEFSRQLENHFHGESSGVDVAIAMEASPLRFLRTGGRSRIQVLWRPHLYLSYCGQKGITSECVKRVNDWRAKNLKVCDLVDQKMIQSVKLAEQSLIINENQNSSEALGLLIQAMNHSLEAFKDWGLVEGALDEHLAWLRSQGALAVKPTGSGGGGYVLSLWKEKPPQIIANKLVSAFMA